MSGTVKGLGGFPQNTGGWNDHVHLLFGLKATHVIADTVRELKKASTNWIHQEIGLRHFYWQEGYAAFTVGRRERDRDSIPSPSLPATFKSFRTYEYANKVTDEIPVIGVMPNPATDQIAFTFPNGTEEGTLEVHDAQGRLVRTIALNGRKGLADDTVRKLEAGLYSVRLLLDGYNVGTTKFTVVK